jgi:hypothetical protein
MLRSIGTRNNHFLASAPYHRIRWRGPRITPGGFLLVALLGVGLAGCGRGGGNWARLPVAMTRPADGNRSDAPRAMPDRAPDSPSSNNARVRAVSLKVLGKQIQSAAAAGQAETDLTQRTGITRVLGYVVDRAHQDILLLGIVDPSRTAPALSVEDFVVLLRNAWGHYVQRKGNKLYYSPPTISIDPPARVVAELDRIARQMHGARNKEPYLARWEHVGRQDQQVRVLGMPAYSHAAQVAVLADYEMKRWVNGSIRNPPIKLVSLPERRLQQAEAALREGKGITAAPSMDRFWFTAADTRYVADTDIVLIRRAAVKLLTEQELFNSLGQRRGLGRPDKQAAAFAAEFTRAYPRIARSRRYAQLAQLFRWAVVARLLKQAATLSQANSALQYWLQGFPLPRAAIPGSLPGITTAQTWEIPASGGGRLSYTSLTCGGVQLDVSSAQREQTWPHQKSLPALRSVAVQMRPSPTAVAWDLYLSPDVETAVLDS